MAFTITSPNTTVTIDGSTATFYATAHAPGGYIYLVYAKGDETSLQLSIAYQSKTLSNTSYFSHVTSYAGTLQPTSYSFTASGSYRVPFVFGSGERRMKITFSNTGGTPTGTIGVDVTDGE